jgi:AP endonuclease-2
VALGKRVFLTGDLNIIREELDTANAEEQMRKHGICPEDYLNTPARRLLNQLLEDSRIFGEPDGGRETPVMFDICRGFHPGRKGMFTCWEQKINARPGNFGSRIDYVLCSLAMKEWFCESNIQEGLMVCVRGDSILEKTRALLIEVQGSDHCPVYAILKETITIDGRAANIQDVMNPEGMFEDGKRKAEYSMKNLLPLSGRLIPEFDKRRSIRDMFKQPISHESKQMPERMETKDTTSTSTPALSAVFSSAAIIESGTFPQSLVHADAKTIGSTSTIPNSLSTVSSKRRAQDGGMTRILKRSKSSAASTNGASAKGQQSLRGFLTSTASRPADPPEISASGTPGRILSCTSSSQPASPKSPQTSLRSDLILEAESSAESTSTANKSSLQSPATSETAFTHDPIVAKESWSKLFSKNIPPSCEGHEEPCITLLTKKPGINCGRSFYICPRPLGPSGSKEKGTQWRCPTFIWCSDWNSSMA